MQRALRAHEEHGRVSWRRHVRVAPEGVRVCRAVLLPPRCVDVVRGRHVQAVRVGLHEQAVQEQLRALHHRQDLCGGHDVLVAAEHCDMPEEVRYRAPDCTVVHRRQRVHVGPGCVDVPQGLQGRAGPVGVQRGEPQHVRVAGGAQVDVCPAVQVPLDVGRPVQRRRRVHVGRRAPEVQQELHAADDADDVWPGRHVPVEPLAAELLDPVPAPPPRRGQLHRRRPLQVGRHVVAVQERLLAVQRGPERGRVPRRLDLLLGPPPAREAAVPPEVQRQVPRLRRPCQVRGRHKLHVGQYERGVPQGLQTGGGQRGMPSRRHVRVVRWTAEVQAPLPAPPHLRHRRHEVRRRQPVHVGPRYVVLPPHVL
eukprot:PhM_4_TR14616/c4_g1_i1/m.84437